MSPRYYHDHWLDIEDERMERYEKMFEWRHEQNELIEGARLEPGLTVVDFGSGPGHLACELGRIVGSEGQVIGLDINAEFVRRSRARAQKNNLSSQITFKQLTDETIPLETASVDRIICKNVLEYVPDAGVTLREFTRILKPDGIVHLIDSDWGFVLVAPWDPDVTRRFFKAAGRAFREPHIGRMLPQLLNQSGFAQVQVEMRSAADQKGGSMAVIRNMATYIRTFDSMPETEVDSMLGVLEQAIHAGEYLFVLPQFLVSAALEESSR